MCTDTGPLSPFIFYIPSYRQAIEDLVSIQPAPHEAHESVNVHMVIGCIGYDKRVEVSKVSLVVMCCTAYSSHLHTSIFYVPSNTDLLLLLHACNVWLLAVGQMGG